MLMSKNIKFVAYLRLHGIHPDKIVKQSRGKAVYGFEMSPDKWQELQQEFDKSEHLKYAQCLDAIMDLAF